jgi:hypothetical protein
VPLYCPWFVSIFVPVVRLVFMFTAHLHMYNKSVLQYCRYIKNDDHHERITVDFPFNI